MWGKTAITSILILLVLSILGCEDQVETCSHNTLDGNVRVDGSNDLSKFSGVTHATGYLSILCEDCEDVEALSCLKTVDGEAVIKDTNLTNLNGLRNLETIGGSLKVNHNSELKNIDGLKHLVNIGGPIEVFSNDSLENLAGLGGLDYEGHLTISVNFAVTRLGDLTNLKSLSALELTELDALTTLEGLEGLNHVGNLSITDSELLENLDGLSNLKALGSNSSTQEEHWIAGNDGLSCLDGLMHLEEAHGDFVILDQDSLSQQEIEELRSYLESIGWTGSIH